MSVIKVFKSQDELKDRETYVLKATRDLPDIEQVHFYLRRLSPLEKTEIEDEMVVVDSAGLKGLRHNTVRLKTLLARLDGWRIQGAPLAFNKADKEAMFDMLSEDIQDELLDFVSPQDKKPQPVDQSGPTGESDTQPR